MFDLKEESEILKKSPMFNLSLSSKELFHSNFLAWLCEIYPAPMGEIIKDYLIDKPVEYIIDPHQVKREEKNKDLTITDKNGRKIIIEMKIKSLPNEEQLIKYSTDNKECKDYLLLNSIKPNFFKDDIFISKDQRWKWVNYSKFIDRFYEIDTQGNLYHSELIKDYIIFTKSLFNLINFCELQKYNNGGFFLKNSDRRIITDLRIHDMIDKMRYYQLAEEVFKKLSANYGDIVIRGDWWDKENGQISVKSEYSNASGITSAALIIHNLYHFIGGVQFQANDFRLFIILRKVNSKEVVKEIDDIINEMKDKKIWFDFSASKLTNEISIKEYPKIPNTKNRIFNQFGDSFKYRYKRVDMSTPKDDIVNGIVDFINKIFKNKDEINKVLNTHLIK